MELQEERSEEYDKLYGKFVWVTDMCLKDGKIRKVKARIEDCGGLFISRHSWSLHPLSDRGLCF